MKSILKQIALSVFTGVLLAVAFISAIGTGPAIPSASELAGVEDRIHVMAHTLDDLEHLYAQSLGCQLFADRVWSDPVIAERMEAK